MRPPAVFVLVHSPIVGSDTWEPVAQELRARSAAVVVPTLTDDGAQPFWRQHVTSVVDAVEEQVSAGADLIVAMHSGAGQLAGHLASDLSAQGHGTAAVVFVDAGLPPQGRSRLDQVRDEASEFAEELEQLLAAGHPFPDWNDEQLRPLVPDAQRRSRVIAGIRHLPSGYWTETIPPVPGWDSVPVGVLLLSSGYETTATTAEQRGWPIRRLDIDNHFYMLKDPAGVAEALDELAQRLCHVANEFAVGVVRWAGVQGDVRAVGLVGSYARGTAGPDSDIDLIVVVDDVEARLASREWLDDLGEVADVEHEDWGLVQSLRVHYHDGPEVEFGLTTVEWPRPPVDAGTAAVVRDGLRVLFDPDRLLAELLETVSEPEAVEDQTITPTPKPSEYRTGSAATSRVCQVDSDASSRAGRTGTGSDAST